MSGGNFFDIIDNCKKEYAQLQAQLSKCRADADKKNQEVANAQKQAQTLMENISSAQLEILRGQEITKRLQGILQNIVQHLPADTQATTVRMVEQAMKVTPQDVMMMQMQQQHQQMLQQVGFGNPAAMAAALGGMDMKQAEILAMAAMQGMPGMNPIQAAQQAQLMAQMAPMAALFQNQAAAAAAAAPFMPPMPPHSMMQQLAGMQQQAPKLQNTTPTSASQVSAVPFPQMPLNGTQSPVQRANSSRSSGSHSGTPLPKKFKQDNESQSRPISTSGKSDKSDEGNLTIDVQNEEPVSASNGVSYLNPATALMNNGTGPLNGTVAV